MKQSVFAILLSAFIFQCCLFSNICSAEPNMQTFLSEYYNSAEKNSKEYSKLLYAVEKGYRNIALNLLDKGEDPNYLPQNQQIPTPFISAIFNEDEALVSAMIKKGAIVNLKSYLLILYSEPVTPLFVAAKANKAEKITQILCSNGAKCLGNDFLSWILTPIGVSIAQADMSKFLIIAKTLTDNEIKKIDYRGQNLLSISTYPTSKQHKENSIKIANYLFGKGVPIESASISALVSSIRSGNKELFDFLLSLGANVNFKSEDIYCNEKPLVHALFYYENREEIIKNRPELNEKIASELEFFKPLFDAGAHPNFSFCTHKKDDSGNYERASLLNYSIEKKLNEMIVLLISYGANVNMIDLSKTTPLIKAVEMNDLKTVELLLFHGASPTKIGGQGKSPIDIAYSRGYKQILNALIEAESKQFD